MYAIAHLDIPPLASAGGTVRLPGSKSISNRVLLLSALSAGHTDIADLLDSDDTRVMLAALDQLGCRIEQRPDNLLRVRGFPFGKEVADFIAEHDQVFVVAQNRDAQLRTLLVNELEIDPRKLIEVLFYDGTPITARFIAGAIGAKAAPQKVVPFRKVVS